MKKDNSTIAQKIALRQSALREIESPIIMETHGGYGEIYSRCYSHVERGIVFEKDEHKSTALSIQRPTWAVYEGDCVTAIADGVGAHLKVNYVDVDPYGEPWPVFDALFGGKASLAMKVAVVVNDGLRQKLKLNGGWSTNSMREAVSRWGNENLHDQYLEICRWLLEKKAAQLGYKLSRWTGYYCGHAKQMTHYAATLRRDG